MGLATVGAMVGAAALLRLRLLSWGATGDEQRGAVAGDDVLLTPDISTTRSITIRVPVEDVWPWLAQLGQGRGGFYSYDWLENLVAHTDIHNSDRIVPEWQQIAIGSEVRLAPEIPLIVVALHPGRALVLRGSVPMGSVAPPYDFTWAFVLVPRPDGTTRLVVRERYLYTRRWAALIVQPATLVSCLMTRKMMRGIKIRAERRHAVSRPGVTRPWVITGSSPRLRGPRDCGGTPRGRAPRRRPRSSGRWLQRAVR